MQGFFSSKEAVVRRGTEVVVTGSTRNRFVLLKARHVGSNPTLSAKKCNKRYIFTFSLQEHAFKGMK